MAESLVPEPSGVWIRPANKDCSSCQRSCAVSEKPQHVPCMLEGVGDETAGHSWADRIKPIFQRSCHAEVSAAATNCPEKVGVFLLAGPHHFSIRGREFGRKQIIESQPVLAHDPAESA